jgi:hypothetical protein
VPSTKLVSISISITTNVNKKLHHYEKANMLFLEHLQTSTSIIGLAKKLTIERVWHSLPQVTDAGLS